MMKISILSGLLALIIMSSVSSCNITVSSEPDIISYPLDLSFQDASGNDLASGIGLEDWCCPTDIPEEQAQSGSVKRDLYVLDIIASQSCEEVIDSWNNHHYVTSTHRLGMNKFNGYWFLTTDLGFDVKDCSNEKILTYKLKCPYVFGDEAAHEFITFWDIPKIRNNSAIAKCNRIEFEGRIYTSSIVQGEYSSRVVIILEVRKDE